MYGPDDAPAHTKKASTRPLRKLWAQVANEKLMADSRDEGGAVRYANGAVRDAVAAEAAKAKPKAA